MEREGKGGEEVGRDRERGNGRDRDAKEIGGKGGRRGGGGTGREEK